MPNRPSSVDTALEQLSELCGELSRRRRRGNFFASTLKKLDAEDESMCDAIRVVVHYMEELEGETDHLSAELGHVDADEEPLGGALHALGECTGKCEAELAKEHSPEELAEMAEQHGIIVTPEEMREQGEHVIEEKAKGHECSVCAAAQHGSEEPS